MNAQPPDRCGLRSPRYYSCSMLELGVALVLHETYPPFHHARMHTAWDCSSLLRYIVSLPRRLVAAAYNNK